MVSVYVFVFREQIWKCTFRKLMHYCDLHVIFSGNFYYIVPVFFSFFFLKIMKIGYFDVMTLFKCYFWLMNNFFVRTASISSWKISISYFCADLFHKYYETKSYTFDPPPPAHSLWHIFTWKNLEVRLIKLSEFMKNQRQMVYFFIFTAW